MKIRKIRKCRHQFKQGDLLSVTLTDAGRNQYIKTPVKGWLIVNEVATTGHIINANFMHSQGSKGYGNVMWPKFRLNLIIRGTHGECSPFAALQTLKRRSGLTEFVNAK